MSESSSTPKEEQTVLPPPIEIAKIAAVLCRDNWLDNNTAAIASLEHKHQKMAKKANKTVERIREGMLIGDNERRFDGRAMFEEFMAKRAVFEEGSGKVRYWELEDSFLDSLVAWRCDV